MLCASLARLRLGRDARAWHDADDADSGADSGADADADTDADAANYDAAKADADADAVMPRTNAPGRCPPAGGSPMAPVLRSSL